MSQIAIIKYNAGNTGSVVNALGRLGVTPIITDDPKLLASAGKVIFPGVGEAGTTMKYLRDTGLDSVIKSLTQPVLGICLGMQLMCRSSEEGNTQGLGIFDEEVRLFKISEKVPHMGWNTIGFKPEGLFAGMTPGVYVYFVHSYYAECGAHTAAMCNYGIEFSAALQSGNFYGTQFHPEKSGEIGMQILENFLKL
jgi:glutamine amidotransferase